MKFNFGKKSKKVSRRKQIKKLAHGAQDKVNEPGLLSGMETLEPRIMLSASWVDADTGDAIMEATAGPDIFMGTAADDIVDALAGDDDLFGGGGDDILDGGTGDDRLFGENGSDILISGGGNDFMDGGNHDDVFQFDGAQDGDVITVIGGNGNDTIDLSNFSASQVTEGDGTLTVHADDNTTFTIQHSEVETILYGNEAPEAGDDVFSTTEEVSVTTDNVLANDTDFEGDALSISNFTQGGHGSVVSHGDGTFTYTPDADFSGTDTFDYTVSDGHGGETVGTVTINVDSLNDAPDAVDDAFSVDEDGSLVTGNVLTNDSDPDGDALSLTGFTQAGHGTVEYNDDGTFTYTPDVNYHGADSFDYTISDGQGGETTGTVNLTVNSVNDGPVVNNESLTTNEDVSVTGNLLSNDSDLDGDALSVSDFTQGEHGTVVNHGDGTFTYTPDADFNGTDTFDYTVSDGNGGEATGVVTIDVNAVEDAPNAVDDSYSVNEDSVLVTGDVLGNDYDAEGDAFSLTDFTQAGHGTVEYNDDGTFTYTPDANYHGADSFTYTISDGMGGETTATVNVTVNSVNDASVVNNETISTNEDVAVTGNVLSNDSDVDGDMLSISDFTQGAHGTVVHNGDGTFTYTPDADFHGTDTFDYTVSDGQGSEVVGSVTVHVNSVNDAPVATTDSYVVDEDAVLVTGNVMANDSDVDGDAMTVSGFSQAGHGTVEYNEDGTFTYTPDENYNGADSFTYTISDGAGGQATETVNLTVNAVNDGPVAENDSVSTDEDVVVTTGNVLANDSDIDGDVLSVSEFTQGAHGTVEYNDDGTFTYTPDANYHGTDSFEYTISDGAGGTATATMNVTIASVNDNPFIGDDTYSTNEDMAVTTGNILLNDGDVDGDDLLVHGMSTPEHGTVFYNGDGTLTYTPDPDFNGTDSFTYTLIDKVGGEMTGTITINVDAVNDAPVATRNVQSTLEDTPFTTIDVLANDTDIDGDVLDVGSFTQPANGTVVYNGDGTFDYTPDANFNGVDIFTYTVDDGAGGTDTVNVRVNVASVNDAPEAIGDIYSTNEDTGFTTGNVLSNDVDVDGDVLHVANYSQPEHGSVSYNGDGTFDYTPDSNYNGADSFTYTILDGNGEETVGTVTVNVGAVNDTPDADDTRVTVAEDSTVVTGNVFDDVTEVDGDVLTVDSFTQPEHGSLNYNDDGTFTYTPDANYYGSDSFEYTISDGAGGTVTATMDINVTSVNDAPNTVGEDYVTNEDTSVTTGNVLANDTDIEGNTLGILDFSQAGHGTVQSHDDGTFTYTPDANFSGEDSFTYTVSDGRNGIVTETVTITVNGVNDDPNAVNDLVVTDHDVAVTTGNVLGNDTDADGDDLSITGFTQADHGTVTDNGDGTFTYTPDGGYSGEDSFTYTVSDGQGGTDTATVTINVVPDNYAPEAGDDTVYTDANNPITTGNVLDNDTDAEGDALSITGFTQGSHGTVVDNGDGTFTYTPDADYTGDDSFEYTVTDGNGNEDTATVTVHVDDGINDGPDARNDAFSVDEDAVLVTGDVLGNDVDANGDALSVTGFTQAGHGIVSYNDDGTFTYTPDENYNGSDSFTYTITDGNGGTDTATVNITVNPVGDGVIAVDDTVTLDEDGFVTTGNVIGNDIDIEGGRTIVISGFTQPEHGSVSYNDDGTFNYSPDADYNGTDSFEYTIYDGHGNSDTATVTITVNSINDAPDTEEDSFTTNEDTVLVTGNVLGNDSDVEGDALSISGFTQAGHGTVSYNDDGTFTYTPDANYHGSDSFTYTVQDIHGDSSTETVEITVNSVNDLPVAVDDVATGDEDTIIVTGDVLANDSDVDGDTVLVYNYTQPEHGSVRYNGDGTFTYDSDLNYHGTDTFEYTVTDGQGGFATATMTITVDSVNDAPEAMDLSYTTDEDTVLTTDNVFDNEFDVDLEELDITIIDGPDHGDIVYNGDGTFTYTPDADWNGQETITYTIEDAAGASDTATIVINVRPVNDAPVAGDDVVFLDEDQSISTASLLGNDVDVDGNVLQIPWFTQPEHGSLTYNSDGTFDYTPDANYNGSDSFTYTVIDGQGGEDTATVTFEVAPVNDAPDANRNWYQTNEDTPYTTGDVLGNDSDLDGDAITLTGFTQPSHGTVTYNDDGTFNYVPDADYHGYDKFYYTISDPDGLTDTSYVTIRVNEVNDAPVATGESVTLNEDTVTTTMNVLSNDTDVDGDNLGVNGFTQPDHGTIEYNNDGTFTYTPDADYNGTDSFTYTVVDWRGGEATATMNLTINAVNDAVRFGSDDFSTLEDTDYTTGDVLANDYDIEGDSFAFEGYTGASHGTVTYNDDGTFTYSPDENYHGTDSFTYTVSDEHGAISTNTIHVTVDSVNDGPVGQDDVYSTDEDTPATVGNVLANDSDVDGDVLTVSDFTQPEHGSVVSNDDGTFDYVPDANYNGTDSFTYTVSDGQGGFDTKTVTINVNSVNDAPITNDDLVVTDEDTAVTVGNVLANDSDIDGGVLSVSDFTQAGHGTVVNNGDGTFEYVPDANYHGTDSFTYTVSDGQGGFTTETVEIQVQSVNDGPVAGGDAFNVTEDTGTVLDLGANDTDVDGDVLVVSGVVQPEHGSVVLNGDGTVTYTPDADYTGADSFTYTISDGHGGTDTATVDITVNEVNDSVVAVADAYSTDEDVAVTTGDVLANDVDVDGDVLSVDGYTQPEHGEIEYNNDGTFTYTPDADYNGTDSFTYTVSDGAGGLDTQTVTITIGAVNDGPVAVNDVVNTPEDTAVTVGNVLANDTDVDGDVLSVIDFTQPEHGTVINNGDGTFEYVPDANYYGPDSFTYTISDGAGGTDTATVNVSVGAIFEAPDAGNDAYTTNEDTSFTIDSVLGNDIDVDGDAFTIDSFTQTEHGQLVQNGDGSFTYTPDANYHGDDSFTYTIVDETGLTDTATVDITVVSVNDAPVATGESAVTSEETLVVINGVLANDVDVDGDVLTVDSFTQGSHGTVVFNGDETFAYTPGENFTGTDSFTYTISDGQGGFDTATITISVGGVNDAPEATGDVVNTAEDTDVTFNVLVNDTDVDGDDISVAGFTQPEHGELVSMGNGEFEYVPDANYHGSDSFTYTVTDGNGLTDVEAVTINVSSVNDAPVAEADAVVTDEDTAVTIANVLGNDSDVDGDTLTVSGFTMPEHGQLTSHGDGIFEYVPDANYFGDDSFTYTVSDGHGGFDSEVVHITVGSVNDAPVAEDDALTLNEDETVRFNAIQNDWDIENDEISVVNFEQPEHGEVRFRGDGTFEYTPDANYHGRDSFTYTITDSNGDTAEATVDFKVRSVNDAPVTNADRVVTDEDTAVTIDNVMSNDSDVDGDTLKISDYTQPEHGQVRQNGDGSFVYTPEGNYNGEDSFTYTVSDGQGGSATETVTVDVASVNDAPTVDPDTIEVSVQEDDNVIIGGVLDGASDVDGDSLEVGEITQPTHGTVEQQDDGTFKYTPDSDYHGDDSFTYTIDDGQGGTVTRTVNVTVEAVNDPDSSDNDPGDDLVEENPGDNQGYNSDDILNDPEVNDEIKILEGDGTQTYEIGFDDVEGDPEVLESQMVRPEGADFIIDNDAVYEPEILLDEIEGHLSLFGDEQPVIDDLVFNATANEFANLFDMVDVEWNDELNGESGDDLAMPSSEQDDTNAVGGENDDMAPVVGNKKFVAGLWGLLRGAAGVIIPSGSQSQDNGEGQKRS